MPLAPRHSTHDKTHLFRMDCLRGVAILLVFLCHSANAARWPQRINLADLHFHSPPTEIFYQLLSRCGLLGVDLFFVISGFLIHLSYLRESCEPHSPARCSGALDVRRYYSKRFWRIYPPYLGALALAMLLHKGIMTGHIYPFWTALHFLLLQNLAPQGIAYISLVFWSLCVEVQIYLFYPVLLKIRRSYGLKWCVLGALALNFLGIAFGSAAWMAHADPSVPRWWMLLPTTQFITWLAGFCLAENYFYQAPKGAIKPPSRDWLWLLVVTVPVLVCLLSFQLLGILRVFLALWLFLFMGRYVRREVPLGMLERFLQVVGQSSYSFYLLHTLALHQIWACAWTRLPNMSDVLRFSLCTCIVSLAIFPVSWVYYQLIEKTSISLGRRMRAKVPRQAATNLSAPATSPPPASPS